MKGRATIASGHNGSPRPPLVNDLHGLISTNADGAIEAHDLRTRHAGRMMFIDFHLVVPSSMSVAVAHDICDRLERAIRAEFPDALISIHVEPDNQAKHSGIVAL
jgi:divalent metal cation (Fe/Co/Zn/Cd) transporter